MWATLLQFFGVVENAKAIISLAATVSHNLNSTLNLSSETFTLPVTKAWAFINLQSSNLGLTWAISGFCTKESFFKGLNNPDLLKLTSITSEILSPTFFIISCCVFISIEPDSICKGETAIGRGSKFPLVIST